MTLLEELKSVLREDDRVVSEGKLLRNKTMELALKNDEKLLRLLMSKDRIKDYFFTRVGGALVFDKDRFIRFVNNKQFLPDSYTTFKNKIGLTEEGEYLDKKKEVVLAWPYKDCVLEGEQVDPNEKRNEVFWNETLAPDEIDRLLDPKVLTNFKRIEEKGEHENIELNPNDNLIIRGNNLLVLHSLKKKFKGKIKLIYIDPPYNTGSDEFNYNDKFNHSTWLTFMKNRLEIARELLDEQGVIFVHCDDNEQAYLKVLMDEIFNRENFIGMIVTLTNRSGRDYGGIARTHDYVLVYAKTENYELYNLLDKDKEFPYEDKLGGFEVRELRNRNIRFNKENRPNLFYPFYVDPDKVDDNGFFKLSLEKKPGYEKVLPKKSQGVQTVWRWSKEKSRQELNKNLVSKKMKSGKLQIVEKYRDKSHMARSVWYDKEIRNEKGTLDLKELFGGKSVFDYPKSEDLIMRIIEMGSKKGDIVLDFSVGSGTTSAVAHKMNRKYIGIEQLNYMENVTIPRLKKVIKGEQTGISQSVGWKGGGSFVYCELMKWNQKYIDKIGKARTSDELLEIWKDMKEEAFLSYKVDPQKFDENADEFKDLSLEDQKKFLIECLNKNHLYVNLSEIDDKEYDISEEDKRMNKQFYEGLNA